MIEKKLLLQAVKTLKKSNEKYYADPSKKKPLLDGETQLPIYLQITLKKIPNSKSIKMIKVNLPHSLLKDSTEICLITGDMDKRNPKAEIEPDILHYKDLLNKHSISAISEVFTLRQLRTEYKPYEAKQKLLAAYDVFLADKKIAECLPKVLGRHFFKKRKFPIQINMKAPNLKQQVEKALSTKVFYLTGRGNSCASEVAYLDMSDSEIFENVVAMEKTLSDQLPGSLENVMGMYLKTPLSKAIPLYMSYDDPSKILVSDDDDDESIEIDELSTIPNVDVKVYEGGRVETFTKKRKIEVDDSSEKPKDDTMLLSKKDKKRLKLVEKNNADSEEISLDTSDNIDSITELTSTSKSKNKKLQVHSTEDTEKEEPIASSTKTRSRRKQEEINNADKSITHSPLQVTKKKKMEANGNKHSTIKESKEEPIASSKKTRSRRKQEEINNADKSITHSPLQVTKKKKMEANGNKHSTIKESKGKKKKVSCL